jgi:hypothetical protein
LNRLEVEALADIFVEFPSGRSLRRFASTKKKMTIIFKLNTARITQSLINWAKNAVLLAHVFYCTVTPFYGGKLLIDKATGRVVQPGDDFAVMAWMFFTVVHWIFGCILSIELLQGTKESADDFNRVRFTAAALYNWSWSFFLWTKFVIYVLPYVVFGVLLTAPPELLPLRVVILVAVVVISYFATYLAGYWFDVKVVHESDDRGTNSPHTN